MNLTDILTSILPEGINFQIFENKAKSGLNIEYNTQPDSNINLQDSQLKTLDAYCSEHGLFVSLFFNKNNKQIICINKSKPRVAASDNTVNSYFG